MSDDRTQPFDALTRWLGEDADADAPHESGAGGPDGPPGDRLRRHSPLRRTVRAAALVAPWLVALAVLGASTGTPGAAPAPTAPPAETGVPGERSASGDGAPPPHDPPAQSGPPAASDHATASPPAGAAASEPASASPVPASAAATAVRLVRDAVTGRHADTSAAIDIAVAEPPRPLGTDQWIVRVQTVVLRGDARRWTSATHETWVVPVGLRAGEPVGLDEPWRVAVEDPAVLAADWSPATVDEQAVRSALRTTGVRAAHDLRPEQHPTLGHVIRVRAAGGAGHVWLTTRPEMRVVGAPTTPAASSGHGAP